MPIGAGLLAAGLSSAGNRLCAASLEKGVSLFVSDDWSALTALNERHRDSWFELLPRPASTPCFWVGALDPVGEVVATHGVVLLDCSVASFGERIADLSAFHDRGKAPADEWAFCASPIAHGTRGHVAWIMAGWNHPDWRGRGLFHLVGAAARLVAMARYHPRWVAGVIDPETVPVWIGRGTVDPRAAVLYHQHGIGRLPLHFMRWSRPAVLRDLGVYASGQAITRTILRRSRRQAA
ncbi:MAG TPA: hypothetical protein VGN75_05580 [Kaistia sp.]|jgi:hypothetical protein|nr:hypothetical protein [Kaistia sp.]